MEYSDKKRKRLRACFIRIMNKIIGAIKMTPQEMEKYVYFMKEILPTLMEPGYTLLDELNLHIKYFKGVDILTYCIPSNPTRRQRILAE